MESICAILPQGHANWRESVDSYIPTSRGRRTSRSQILASACYHGVGFGASSCTQLIDLLRQIDGPFAQQGGGLGNSKITLLRQIDEAGRQGLPQSDACAAMHLSPGAMSKICNELEQIGLVERNSHPVDRRIKCLKLTAMGRAHLQTCDTVLGGIAMNAFANLNAVEMEQLLALLLKASTPVEHKQCSGCLIGGC